MGLFQQMPERHQTEWAGLPSEPRTISDAADTLDEGASVDPSAVYTATTMSIVFPVAPAAPVAEDAEAGEPEGR